MQRVQRLLDGRIIREITPIFDTRALGYSSMLVAAKVDAEVPAPRREDHQLAPGRHAQLPAQPRLQHVVHDRHRARLQARAAGDARDPPGAHGRRVDPRAADAEAVQDPHGPRDGEGHRRAVGRRRGRRAAGARPDRALRRGRRDDPRHPGQDAGRLRALRAGRRAARRQPGRGARAPGVAARARRPAARGGDPLPPPRGLLRQRHGRLEGARGPGARHRAPDGRLPRHLALLPAADLPRLAVLDLHDGPRPLQGGVRRDPRLDRRGDRDRASARRCTRARSSRRSGCSTSPTTSAAGRRSTA